MIVFISGPQRSGADGSEWWPLEAPHRIGGSVIGGPCRQSVPYALAGSLALPRKPHAVPVLAPDYQKRFWFPCSGRPREEDSDQHAASRSRLTWTHAQIAGELESGLHNGDRRGEPRQ